MRKEVVITNVGLEEPIVQICLVFTVEIILHYLLVQAMLMDNLQEDVDTKEVDIVVIREEILLIHVIPDGH